MQRKMIREDELAEVDREIQRIGERITNNSK